MNSKPKRSKGNPMKARTPSGRDRHTAKVKRANRRLLAAVNRSILAAEQARQALAELYRLAEPEKKGR